MTSTTWIDAPAGFSGTGRAGMSPYAWASVVGGARTDMAPVAAPIRGTGLPVAARLRQGDEPGVVRGSFLQAHAVASALSTSADKTDIHLDNNGTTLGIHPPGRPQS